MNTDRETLTLDAVRKRKLEENAAMQVADILEAEYSGHAWGVNIDQGFANIFNVACSTTHGYRLLMPCTKQEILAAGGEVLERFGLPRGKVDPDKPLEVAMRGAL